MTKHMEVCKPTTEGREQVEEGTTTSGKDARTIGKPTQKAPDMQNVQDVTETVMEESGGRYSTKHMGASPMMPVKERRETTGELG